MARDPYTHLKMSDHGLSVMKGMRAVPLNSWHNGIRISEGNRATVYATTVYEVGELLDYCYTNYLSKGIKATLCAVQNPVAGTAPKVIPPLDQHVAVFVEDGFLVDVET